VVVVESQLTTVADSATLSKGEVNEVLVGSDWKDFTGGVNKHLLVEDYLSWLVHGHFEVGNLLVGA